jgi:CubicO group peptidase (beta-lactamase class C family)
MRKQTASQTAAVWVLILLNLLWACSAGPQAASTSAVDTYWPTETWQTSTPEEQGMDSGKLQAMLAEVQASQINLHSLLVIRNGFIVSETYFGAYRQNTRHTLYSCTKSFISTLVGIAIDQGLIKNPDQKVTDLLSSYPIQNLDAQKQAMTLDDLLTMRSGLAWQEGDAAYMELYRSPDWVSYMLEKPMAQPPGTVFNYCSGCSHLLSAIVKQASGMNPEEFAKQYLFKPLGITRYLWEKGSGGLSIGGWGLQLTPRDMAKLGYLFLHQGLWDGQQVVSAAWVQTATQAHTSTDGELGYGYQWWVVPEHHAYTALGLDGQTIYVVPESQLVIVTTATTTDGHDAIFRLIEQFILPAVTDSP